MQGCKFGTGGAVRVTESQKGFGVGSPSAFCWGNFGTGLHFSLMYGLVMEDLEV